MTRFLLRRGAGLVATLLVLTLVIFLFQELSPIDPAREVLGENAPAAAIADFRQRYGLDRPVLVRYADYVGSALTGSFGLSYRTGRPVGQDIVRLLPPTIELGVAAFVLSTGLGALYALSTLRRGRALTAYRAVLLTAAVAPPFLLGIAGLLVFYRWLRWLPAAGRRSGLASQGFTLLPSVGSGDWAGLADAARHLLLPALCVALGSAAVLGRLYASAIRSTLEREFVQTARSKGLSEPAVIRRHVLRNSLSTVLPLTAMQLGGILAGALVIEIVFGWPGLGLYLRQSIAAGDLPAITAVMLLLVTGYVVVNSMADILQAVVDPRQRIA